jgi:hypothetical protein
MEVLNNFEKYYKKMPKKTKWKKLILPLENSSASEWRNNNLKNREKTKYSSKKETAFYWIFSFSSIYCFLKNEMTTLLVQVCWSWNRDIKRHFNLSWNAIAKNSKNSNCWKLYQESRRKDQQEQLQKQREIEYQKNQQHQRQILDEILESQIGEYGRFPRPIQLLDFYQSSARTSRTRQKT